MQEDHETTILYLKTKRKPKEISENNKEKETALEKEQFIQKLEENPNDQIFHQLIKRNRSETSKSDTNFLKMGEEEAISKKEQCELLAKYFEDLAQPKDNVNFNNEKLLNYRNTNSDIDTDAVPFLPEDEPGSQDRTTNSDLNSDSEPYLTETEPQSQGAEAVERRDERSVDRKEQTYIKTGVTGSEQTFRQGVSGGGELIGEQKDNLACATGSQNKQGGYKYDILILHSQYDEGHIDEMKRIIIEKVDLPDVKIASTEDDIPAGANLFAAFNELMDVSRSLLLFITPKFYDDCLSRFRMHTQLVRHYEDGDCVIPVLFGEDKIRKELREIDTSSQLYSLKK
ncbi:unnamed protein product [Mytilus edulis]|uniref:TIR domain-containing protein n=1 Tax=Mytilus edulis TaxID=6550 RepID=A0A8S3R4L8_MYTED|nr:unnamed protein product [Mytilus edulis]